MRKYEIINKINLPKDVIKYILWPYILPSQKECKTVYDKVVEIFKEDVDRQRIDYGCDVCDEMSAPFYDCGHTGDFCYYCMKERNIDTENNGISYSHKLIKEIQRKT